MEITEKIIKSNKNFFITGKAWTGKTTFIKLFTEKLRKSNVNHVILAPTWVAALNVWGVTIHSFFKFEPQILVQEAWRLWEKNIWDLRYTDLKYIIIDEISMVRADLLDCIDIFLRKVSNQAKSFWAIQMIFVGDLYQLSPIVTKKEYDFFKKYPSSYFFSSDVFLRDNFKLELYELTKVYRQKNIEFISILNNIRKWEVNYEDISFINKSLHHKKTNNHIILTTTNKSQKSINTENLKKLSWKEYVYNIILEWKVNIDDTALESSLYLKHWARVMFIQNADDKTYVNWTLWTIIDLNNNQVTIKIDSWNKITINKETWKEFVYEYIYDFQEKIIRKRIRGKVLQLPIKLAWAITIHKSQWITYDYVSIDFWYNWCFADWQAYVALSRCKTFKWLHLERAMDISDIKTNNNINKFLNNNIDSNNQLDYKSLWLELADYEKEIYFKEKWGIDYFNVAKSIIKKINLEWWKAYIVWWFCRNRIMWLTTKTDIDISTDFTPQNIRKHFNVVNDIWKDYGVLVIKEHDFIYEITTFREDINRKAVLFNNKFKDDANRRDFTINAVYLDPLRDNQYKIFNNYIWKSQYISWENIYNFISKNKQNGISDLKNKIIRFIWDPIERIKEDPIRLLRYIRFKYSLNLKDNNLKQYNIVKQNFYLLKLVPFERIKIELEKIFISDWVVDAVVCLKDFWFFEYFIPEINNLENCPGWPKYHLEWNVWKHILLIIEELNKNLIKDPDMYWLALFHDVWKLSTFSQKNNWDINYIWHEKLSEEIFLSYIKKLRFTTKQKEKISWIINKHLLFWRVLEMKKIKLRKLFLHKYWNFFFTFCSADHMGRLPRDFDLIKNIKNQYNDFINIYNNTNLLTWSDIIKKYPKLKWAEIWKRLEELNNEIISNI